MLETGLRADVIYDAHALLISRDYGWPRVSNAEAMVLASLMGSFVGGYAYRKFLEAKVLS